MSFLCRAISRIRGEDKLNDESELPGRITGSDSIDTIVKVGLVKTVGLRPSARRVIVQDFIACTDEELTVRKDEAVYILYRDHEWVYVSTHYGQEGFVPLSYCARQTGRRCARGYSGDSYIRGHVKQNDIEGRIAKSIPPFQRTPSQDRSLDRAERMSTNGKCNEIQEIRANQLVRAATNGWTCSIKSQESYTPFSISKLSLAKENISAFELNTGYKTIPKPTLSVCKTPLKESKPSEGFCSFRPFDKRNKSGISTFNLPLPFKKVSIGKLLVLFDFTALNENDLDVKRGEIVEGLNEEDREWTWVQRGDFLQGFVPYTYLCPLRFNYEI